MKRIYVTILAFLCLLGCASNSGERSMFLPDRDDASSAEGAAYTADGMHFRKAMPSRPDWRPMEFYYKHCSELGEQSYFSKTSYECSSP